MKVTHTTLDSEIYQIYFGEFRLGAAKKVEEGFIGETVFGDLTSSSTMKGLKEEFEKISESLVGLRSRTAPLLYMTIDEARRTGGLSHGGTYQRVKEFSKYHPYLPKRCYGIAIYMEAMQAQARWSGKTGDLHPARWLEENADRLPMVKQLDTEWLEKTRQVRYRGE